MKKVFYYPNGLGIPPRIGYWTIRDAILLSIALLLSTLTMLRFQISLPLVLTSVMALLRAGRGRTNVGSILGIYVRFAFRPKTKATQIKKRKKEKKLVAVRICKERLTLRDEPEVDELYEDVLRLLPENETVVLQTASVHSETAMREKYVFEHLERAQTDGERAVWLAEAKRLQEMPADDPVVLYYIREEPLKGE